MTWPWEHTVAGGQSCIVGSSDYFVYGIFLYFLFNGTYDIHHEPQGPQGRGASAGRADEGHCPSRL